MVRICFVFVFHNKGNVYIFIHISCHSVYFCCVCVCDYSQQIDYIIVPPTPSHKFNINNTVHFSVSHVNVLVMKIGNNTIVLVFCYCFFFYFPFSIRSFPFRWPNFIFIRVHSENSKKNITFTKMLTSISCLK